jgi:hypothetical protein
MARSCPCSASGSPVSTVPVSTVPASGPIAVEVDADGLFVWATLMGCERLSCLPESDTRHSFVVPAPLAGDSGSWCSVCLNQIGAANALVTQGLFGVMLISPPKLVTCRIEPLLSS